MFGGGGGGGNLAERNLGGPWEKPLRSLRSLQMHPILKLARIYGELILLLLFLFHLSIIIGRPAPPPPSPPAPPLATAL